MTQDEVIKKIGLWLKPKFSKLEVGLIIIASIGALLKLLNIGGSNALLFISLPTLSVLYFFYAFTPFDNEEKATKIDTFIKYISYWGLSVAVIGATFALLYLPGYETMLIYGAFTCGAMIIFSLTKILKESELINYYKSNIIRLLVCGLICIALLLTPKENLKKIFQNENVSTEEVSQ